MKFSITAFISLALASATLATPEPTVIKQNGGWCWYQGPRAIVTSAGDVVFTTISGDTFAGYDAGDLWATSWNPDSGKITRSELHDKFQRDDHDVAGLLERPDGKILAVYGKHGSDHLQRWRITTKSGDINKWTEEGRFDVGVGYTYSNIFRLSEENGRIYNFSRTRNWNPNCTISDDSGETWNHGWPLLHWTPDDYKKHPAYTGTDGGRPYLRYASNNKDSIHFVTTEDHPRAFDNSIYHGFYRDGYLHDSVGEILNSPDGAKPVWLTPHSFTRVFEGGKDKVAWTADLALDADGHPYTAFSVQIDGSTTRGKRDPDTCNDHRYYYARFDGKQWHTHEIAYAGTKLYTKESDYTGLIALDPQDPNTVVISTNADPKTGEPLISTADKKRHWELFKGQTKDKGETWEWIPLTTNSKADNLRPIIPDNPSGKTRIILWARGELKTFTDYRLDICGILDDR